MTRSELMAAAAVAAHSPDRAESACGRFIYETTARAGDDGTAAGIVHGAILALEHQLQGWRARLAPATPATRILAGTAKPSPLTLDTVVADYCRDEDDDEAVALSMDEWKRDLDSVAHLGATYDVVSDCEISWRMPLRAAFALRMSRGWFRDDGFYGPDVWASFAAMLDPFGAAVTSKQVRDLWDDFAGPAKPAPLVAKGVTS